jgi:hypothetical protein
MGIQYFILGFADFQEFKHLHHRMLDVVIPGHILFNKPTIPAPHMIFTVKVEFVWVSP